MTNSNTAGNNSAATAQEVLLPSLDDIDLRQGSENAFEFEYIGPKGNKTGIFFSVLGEHAEKVRSETNALLNERRRAEATREAAATSAADAITPIEDDTAFGQRLAAVRLVGWRGLREDYTPARGLRLCQTNALAAAQITQKSRQAENFTGI